MRRRLVLLSTILILLAAACGDDGAVPPGTQEGSSNPTVPSVFVGTPGTLPDPLETIVVESGGESFELPAAVCLRGGRDVDVVLAAAQQQAEEFHTLFARQVSGWPTTTAQPPDQQEIWLRDLNRAGVTALTLAGLAGVQADLAATWVSYEQRLADPEQGWGAPDEISRRVGAWRTQAEALTGAIAATCAG